MNLRQLTILPTAFLLTSLPALSQQTADALVDQADPTKTLKASTRPEIGDLVTKSETLFIDYELPGIGIGCDPDTKLMVADTIRLWTGRNLTENIGQGGFQMCNINYTRGWSANPIGFQSYGGPLEVNPFGLNDIRLVDSVVVKADGRVGLGMDPVHQFDMQGVFRTNDTIVSDKAAGAPFLIASSDVSANLNADLLDGHHADEFLLRSEIDDLPTGGGGGGAPIQDGFLSLAADNRRPFDSSRGIEFPDGSMSSASSNGAVIDSGSNIGQLGVVGQDPSMIRGVRIDLLPLTQENLEEGRVPSAGPLHSTDDTRVLCITVLKPIDDLSPLLYQSLTTHSGRADAFVVDGQGHDVQTPIEQAMLRLTSVMCGPSSEYREVEIFLSDVMVFSIGYRQVELEAQGVPLMEEVSFIARDLNLNLEGGIGDVNLLVPGGLFPHTDPSLAPVSLSDDADQGAAPPLFKLDWQAIGYYQEPNFDQMAEGEGGGRGGPESMTSGNENFESLRRGPSVSLNRLDASLLESTLLWEYGSTHQSAERLIPTVVLDVGRGAAQFTFNGVQVTDWSLWSDRNGQVRVDAKLWYVSHSAQIGEFQAQLPGEGEH